MLNVFKTLEVFFFPSFGTETSMKLLCENITPSGLSKESFQTFTTIVVDEAKTLYNVIPSFDEFCKLIISPKCILLLDANFTIMMSTLHSVVHITQRIWCSITL